MTGCTGNILDVASVRPLIFCPDRHGRLFSNFLDDVYGSSADSDLVPMSEVDYSLSHLCEIRIDDCAQLFQLYDNAICNAILGKLGPLSL